MIVPSLGEDVGKYSHTSMVGVYIGTSLMQFVEYLNILNTHAL